MVIYFYGNNEIYFKEEPRILNSLIGMLFGPTDFTFTGFKAARRSLTS